ncbi:MAG TPA: alpha-(1-_3)-arabinofuranosyltransferase family protein [Streptosporangiaceae bacterium]
MTTVPGLIRSRARRGSAPPDTARKAWRLPLTPGTRRILGFCLLLVALPFLTVPGNLIADTKLDLAVDPARFLARALHLWDPQQFGQLQDQAAGYLFPMGPFFALGRLAGLEPWVIQRLWIGTVSAAAFAGVVLLCGRLGIGSPWSRIAAGLGYAASPAALTLIGGLSSEFLPAAMLPWILLPLVRVAQGAGQPGAASQGWGQAGAAVHGGGQVHAAGQDGEQVRAAPGGSGRVRAAARSAVAVACCGGINAAATFAVLVPAVIYLLTLPRPAPRWRILGWWVPAVIMATWWWSVPLVLLSRYGVSILPYTESAAVTTSATGLSNVLRGTENWISYLLVNGQPWWRVGYRIATGAVPILLTGLASGLGLAGLLRPRLPARRFLLCLLLTGLLLICAGHVSTLGNPLAGPVQHLINGPAAAFRNVRKFDPLIRLPIVLGLAHLLASVRLPRPRALLAAAAALAIGGLALPAYAGGLEVAGAFRQIPPYWVSAANWLNRHAGHQAVLVLPGAAFGQYLWGSPLDDVLQPLTTADWAERDLSLIGSPGNERLLDAIDQRLAAGAGSAAVTSVLARMGVRYVLVRNDLARTDLNGAWPARISQALAASPGITRVAQFGAPVGTTPAGDAATDFDPPYPPVQIYQVAGAQPVATVQPAAGTLRVYGGPEALLTLAGEGLLGHRAVLLNSDSPGLPATASVVTDTLRRRVRNFGELRTNYSPTLTATQDARTFEAVGDYTEPGWARDLSVARYQGITNVTASSSAAGIEAIPGQWASGLLPYSAVDGDRRTMWESGSLAGAAGQWIRLSFGSRRDPRVIEVAFTDSTALGPAVTQVAVSTAAGSRTDRVQVTGLPQPLPVPPGPTRWLQITVTGLASPPQPLVGSQVGIKEIMVPGLHASRVIVAPGVPYVRPAVVVLAKAQPLASPCMLTPARWVCSPALARPVEEQYGFDQAFTMPAAARATLRGSAVLFAPSLVNKYLRLLAEQPQVGASSRYTRAPQDQPRSAFDGNPATTWIASPGDANPVLTISWRHRLTVRTVTIQRPPGADGPLPVLVSGERGQARGGVLGPAGVLRFAPIRTRELAFRFSPPQTPLQISGVTIPGVPALQTPSGTFRLPCGLGPVVALNGRVLPTQVTGTFAELLGGQPMSFTACPAAPIAAGANRVVEPAADPFDVQDVVLQLSRGGAAQGSGTPGGAALGPAPGPATVAVIRSWTPARRVLAVAAPARSYLVVNENFNAGWQARLDGRPLSAARLDGWKQAWLLPAGTAGTVTLTYRPDVLYRDALAGGLGGLALVVLVALWPGTPAWRPRWLRLPGAWRRVRARRKDTARAAGEERTGPLASRSGRAEFEGTGPGVLERAGPERAGAGGSPRARGRPRPGLTTGLATAAIGCLLLAGLWLGGYPGAVILTAATALFAVADSYRRAHWAWYQLSRPWVVAVLLLAAAACGAVGGQLLLAGATGPLAQALVSTAPQVICLAVVGRMAAALAVGDP